MDDINAGSPAIQDFGQDPLETRETDHYQKEYVQSFVEKWDELIDWDARAESEGRFFIDMLKARGKHKVLDVATGTGFHSVQLLKAGFDVTSADGNAEMLTKAFENARARGLVLHTAHADWRWLNRDVHGKFDAIICLGNSFTHLFHEKDRRRALAELYAALRWDGILLLVEAQVLLLRRPGDRGPRACGRGPGALLLRLPRRLRVPPEHVPPAQVLHARAAR